MTTKQELLKQLESEINRSKVIIRDLREQKENLRQDILQSEIDNLEKYMAESEVKMSSIFEAASEAWDDLSRDIQELITRLKEAGDRILGK